MRAFDDSIECRDHGIEGATASLLIITILITLNVSDITYNDNTYNT
jgi:hypothetical protein